MLADIEILARRLEQQITSFEKLHADEMKRFEEQFAVFQRLQNDELQMLRAELKQLQDEIARAKQEETEQAVTDRAAAPPKPADAKAVLMITRRDLLTGNISPRSRT